MTSRRFRIHEGSTRLRLSAGVLGRAASSEATNFQGIDLGAIASISHRLPVPHRVGIRFGRIWVAALVGFLVFALTFPWIGRIPHLFAAFCADQAQLHFDNGRFAQSATYLKWALDVEPNNALLHHRLAKTEEQLGDSREALSEYQRAIQIDHSFHDAYLDLAGVYANKLRDFPSSVNVLQSVLRDHPNSVSARYAVYAALGKSELGRGDLNSAQRALIEAIQLAPARGAAHCLLAEVLDLRGKRDGALSEWGSCAAMSKQPGVEQQWLVAAQQRLGFPHQP